jgi:WD40 repeat protein/tetratricopeptide (TPR) repeat protein
MSLGAWLEQAVVPKLMVATGGPIDCITVSPDRRTVVTGHNDGVLRSWDTTSGRPLGSVQAHEGAVFFLSFCPGRDVVASIGTRLDPTTRLWDARSLSPAGNPIRHRASGQTRAFFTFRRDGGILATYSPDDGAVRTWVVSTCLPFGPLISHPGVISAVFSPDGTRLATAGRDRFVRFWDIATGTALGEPLAHSSIVQGVAFSPDSRLLATIDGDDHELSQGEKRNSSLRIWEVAKGRRVAAADPGPPRPTVVAFHPTGRTIVLGGVNRPVQIYDAETATPVGPPLVHSDGAHEIAFSPDGRMIMSSSEDSGTRLIDANTGRPIGSVVEHGDRVVGAVFSPDSLSILTATQNGWLRTWDDSGVVSSGRPFPHPFGVQTAEFSPDGRIVATAGFDGTARLFDLDTRQPVGPPLIHSTRVRAARFRPDGQVLATGGDDDTVRLWDVATGRPIGQPLPHGDWVLNLRFSPDGQRLLVGRVAAQAKLWNLSAKPPRGTVLQHPDRVRGFEVWNVEFTRDGRVAITGDNGGTLAFWDAETGQRLGEAIKVAHGIDQILQARTGQNFFVLASGRIYTLDCEKRRITSPPFGDQITTIALSPDGKTLLAGRSDKNAQLWNPTTGREIGPRMRHDRAVRGVTFSPDGALLATVTIEGKARLWDASTGKPIGPPLEHPGWITRWGWDNRQPLAFAPDGRTLVTAGNHAVLWPVPAAMTADVARLATAISALVGLRFDATGGLQRLEPSEWSLELGALADALDARQEPLALHDRIAASCEQFGPPASALWHLDVLIADKPGDWTLHARRARIRSQLGDLTGAAADEARAITLGPSERIHSWRSHWLQDRAAEAEARRQWPEAVAHLNGLADLIGENAGLRFRRGEAHAQLGNWAAAASDLAAAIEPSSPFSESFGRIFRRRLGSGGVTSERLRPERLILYQLASGDSEAYRASCSSLRRHVRPGSDPRLDLFLVYLLTLGPDGAVDPSLSVRLAEAALRALTKGDALWAERYLGSALYRAGRYDEAVRRLEPNAKAGGPWDWAFLAMSHHHLGQDTEARRWLDRLRTRARSTGPHALLDDLEFDLLRREAETVVLLDPAFPTNPLAEPPPGYDSRQSGSGSLGSKTR